MINFLTFPKDSLASRRTFDFSQNSCCVAVPLLDLKLKQHREHYSFIPALRIKKNMFLLFVFHWNLVSVVCIFQGATNIN